MSYWFWVSTVPNAAYAIFFAAVAVNLFINGPSEDDEP